MKKTTIKSIIDGDVNDLKSEWILKGNEWLLELKEIEGLQEWWMLNNALEPWLLFKNHWKNDLNIKSIAFSSMDIVFMQEWMKWGWSAFQKNKENPIIKTNKLDWLVWLEQFYWTKSWIWDDSVWLEIGHENTEEVQIWIIKNKLKHDFCWLKTKTQSEINEEIKLRKNELRQKIVSFLISKEG